MKNTGTTIWQTNGETLTNYFLKSLNQDWVPYGTVPIPNTKVAPGKIADFNFTITAPIVDSPTHSDFQWSMTRQGLFGVTVDFGMKTPNVPITVYPANTVLITGHVTNNLSKASV